MFFRSLWRDVVKEIHVSRNLRESWLTGCCRAVLCLLCLCKAMWTGVRAIGHERLGSSVIHEGQKRFISNWAGSEFPTIAGDGFYLEYVPRSELTSVINASELWHRFTFGVTFYTGYHMDNDINKRLYPQAFTVRS